MAHILYFWFIIAVAAGIYLGILYSLFMSGRLAMALNNYIESAVMFAVATAIACVLPFVTAKGMYYGLTLYIAWLYVAGMYAAAVCALRKMWRNC
jgi:hypothetical protein